MTLTCVNRVSRSNWKRNKNKSYNVIFGKLRFLQWNINNDKQSYKQVFDSCDGFEAHVWDSQTGALWCKDSPYQYTGDDGSEETFAGFHTPMGRMSIIQMTISAVVYLSKQWGTKAFPTFTKWNITSEDE